MINDLSMIEMTHSAFIDMAARVLTRHGDHGLRPEILPVEAANGAPCAVAPEHAVRSDDVHVLLGECYARTAQGLSDSLLRAETAPGTALDKVAAFLVRALEIRRARGTFLSFRRGGDLPVPLQRRLHEHDTAVRMRLKRVLSKGRSDGSLALRNLDTAVELLLSSLQAPAVVIDGPEQRMWDSELTELLLAGLCEPHPPEVERRAAPGTVQGACLCGAVRFEIEAPFDLLSHCRCSACRTHQGAAVAPFLTVPIARFRWVEGEERVTLYQSAERGRRSFCGRCGSVTPLVETESGVVYCPRSAQAPPFA